MALRPKDQAKKDLAKKAAAYRQMAEGALMPSVRVDFAECAERYEIVAAALERAPTKETLEEVG